MRGGLIGAGTMASGRASGRASGCASGRAIASPRADGRGVAATAVRNLRRRGGAAGP